MGVKFGEIDSSQILHNEFRINLLEGIVNLILSKNPSVTISHNDINKIRLETVQNLTKKYPNSGIKLIEN